MNNNCLTIGVILILAESSAWAQQPVSPVSSSGTEQVTVTATKLRDQIQSFVQSLSAPSPALNKLARWRDGICPIAAGMVDSLEDRIERRVREIAAMVGAPVAPEHCKGNIDIILSYGPQIILDNVRAHHPVLLGYHDVSHEEELATVRHMVQAWYATETADLVGNRNLDNKQTHDYSALSVWLPAMCFGCTVPSEIDISGARTAEVTGNHMSDGLSSELYHVIVTVNSARISDDMIAPITDYIAMLALAQTDAFDTCQQIPSIANFATDNCPLKPLAITEGDLAFLRALYKVSPTSSSAMQRHDIVEEMEKALVPR